ncbi:ABC transporter ATP-binding protein [Erysipelotrichaceae bacterium]|nr:ABC transporter ATP-binding protein [Erysipelotrichaceae bacterium]
MKNKIMKKIAIMGAGLLFISGCTTPKSDVEITQIGILQIAEHGALDNARKGFIETLAAAGYIDGENIKIDYQNAQGDQSNLKSMSEKLVKKSDLLFAISTPAAQALANETKQIPILFTAVTDPVDAGLVNSLIAPGGNITGTSDMAPVKKQIELLYAIKPDAKKVGILYNSSETNSKLQANQAKAVLTDLGIEAIEMTVTSTNDVQQVAESIVKQVDAIYIPTDNTLAASMATIKMVVEKSKTVVITGSVDDAMIGGLATYGIDYEKLGQQTAQQAIGILRNGQNPGILPVEMAAELTLFVNEEMAEVLGIDKDIIKID